MGTERLSLLFVTNLKMQQCTNQKGNRNVQSKSRNKSNRGTRKLQRHESESSQARFKNESHGRTYKRTQNKNTTIKLEISITPTQKGITNGIHYTRRIQKSESY